MKVVVVKQLAKKIANDTKFSFVEIRQGPFKSKSSEQKSAITQMCNLVLRTQK